MAGKESAGARRSMKHFGDFLVEKGLIEPQERDDALAIQNAINVRLGILATIEEVITVSEVYEVLEYQRETGKPFGEAAHDLGLLNEQEVEALLDHQQGLRMKVGEILVGLMYLKREEMEQALEHFLEAAPRD